MPKILLGFLLLHLPIHFTLIYWPFSLLLVSKCKNVSGLGPRFSFVFPHLSSKWFHWFLWLQIQSIGQQFLNLQLWSRTLFWNPYVYVKCSLDSFTLRSKRNLKLLMFKTDLGKLNLILRLNIKLQQLSEWNISKKYIDQWIHTFLATWFLTDTKASQRWKNSLFSKRYWRSCIYNSSIYKEDEPQPVLYTIYKN